jgi:uncharacterized protein (TIGR00725 family)
MGLPGIADVRRVITVIGSGDELTEAQQQWPLEVGRWVASAGFHLLTGAGGGVMEAASRGFCSVGRAGLCIGIIPSCKDVARYPNRWVELRVFTHLVGADPMGPDSRNNINVLSADAIVMFPGSAGTHAELQLALARATPCPIVACVRDGEAVGGLGRDELAARGVALADSTDDVARLLAKEI